MGKALRRTAFSASAAIVTAALAAQPATALEYNFGGVQVFLDTTVSAGVSMRVADRNNMFLAGGNGGPTKSLASVQNRMVSGRMRLFWVGR